MDTVISYLSPDTTLTNMKHMQIMRKPLIQVQKAMLGGCKAYLTEIGKDGEGPRLMKDFSKGDTWFELNGIFTRTCLRELLERKDYCPFSWSFLLW